MNLIAFSNPSHKEGGQTPRWSYSIKEGDEWVSVVAIWEKFSKNGKPYLSIAIDEDGLKKYQAEQTEYKKTNTRQVKSEDNEVDDLPF